MEVFNNLALFLFQRSFRFLAEIQPPNICVLKYLYGICSLNTSCSPSSLALWHLGCIPSLAVLCHLSGCPCSGDVALLHAGARPCMGQGREQQVWCRAPHFQNPAIWDLFICFFLTNNRKFLVKADTFQLCLNVIFLHKGIFRADSWRSSGSHHIKTWLMLFEHEVCLPGEAQRWRFTMRYMQSWHMGPLHTQKWFLTQHLPWNLLPTHTDCPFIAERWNSHYMLFPSPCKEKFEASAWAETIKSEKYLEALIQLNKTAARLSLCAATEVTRGTTAGGQAGEARNCSAEASPDHVWHVIYLLLLQVSLAKEVGERSTAQRAVYFPVEWTILNEQD